jgi:tRNA nucleotidyltransferase (CCA-adding enzyme)
VVREHGNIHRSETLGAAALLRLLERCDALRRPERFEEVLLACECDARGRLGFGERPYPQRERLLTGLRAAQSVDSGVIARAVMQESPRPRDNVGDPPATDAGPRIARALHAARAAAVAQALKVEHPT